VYSSIKIKQYDIKKQVKARYGQAEDQIQEIKLKKKGFW